MFRLAALMFGLLVVSCVTVPPPPSCDEVALAFGAAHGEDVAVAETDDGGLVLLAPNAEASVDALCFDRAEVEASRPDIYCAKPGDMDSKVCLGADGKLHKIGYGTVEFTKEAMNEDAPSNDERPKGFYGRDN